MSTARRRFARFHNCGSGKSPNTVARAIGLTLIKMDPARRAEIASVIAREDNAEAIAVTIRQLMELARTPGKGWRRTDADSSGGAAHVDQTLMGQGLGKVLTAKAGRTAMDKRTVDDESVDWVGTELLGVCELAQKLGVAQASIDRWRKARSIIAFSKGAGNFVYPVGQFEGMRPLPGLDRVLAEFESAEDAWEWLNVSEHIVGGVCPLDALRDGNADHVVSAARGRLDFA